MHSGSGAISKTNRLIFLDQIKAIMITLVIATHTILVGTLFTTDLKQTIELAPTYEALSFWFGWICNTFYMNILFLISGYLVPNSVHKRGVEHYVKHRLLRLGIPLIIAILAILLYDLTNNKFFSAIVTGLAVGPIFNLERYVAERKQRK